MIFISALLAVLALGLVVYSLHQLGLFLERQGYIYYWHTKPSGGGSSVFVPLQEFTQPQVKHVIEVSDEKWRDEEDSAGDGERDQKSPHSAK